MPLYWIINLEIGKMFSSPPTVVGLDILRVCPEKGRGLRSTVTKQHVYDLFPAVPVLLAFQHMVNGN